MKKLLYFVLLLSMITSLAACSAKSLYDLSDTTSIEIHAYDNESAEPFAQFVVNGDEVAILTQMFSSLKLKELKYTEPSIRGYVFWFRNENGEEIARRIERRSIETLVEPYEGLEALTPGQIQYLLDEGAKRRQKTAS